MSSKSAKKTKKNLQKLQLENDPKKTQKNEAPAGQKARSSSAFECAGGDGARSSSDFERSVENTAPVQCLRVLSTGFTSIQVPTGAENLHSYIYIYIYIPYPFWLKTCLCVLQRPLPFCGSLILRHATMAGYPQAAEDHTGFLRLQGDSREPWCRSGAQNGCSNLSLASLVARTR